MTVVFLSQTTEKKMGWVFWWFSSSSIQPRPIRETPSVYCTLMRMMVRWALESLPYLTSVFWTIFRRACHVSTSFDHRPRCRCQHKRKIEIPTEPWQRLLFTTPSNLDLNSSASSEGKTLLTKRKKTPIYGSTSYMDTLSNKLSSKHTFSLPNPTTARHS